MRQLPTRKARVGLSWVEALISSHVTASKHFCFREQTKSLPVQTTPLPCPGTQVPPRFSTSMAYPCLWAAAGFVMLSTPGHEVTLKLMLGRKH